MVVGGLENHLALLLRNFSESIYLSYMSKLNSLISLFDDFESEINIVESHDHAGTIAFRISFDFPVYMILSHPICRFSNKSTYPVREGMFIANRGLVPVFFPGLNIMTVLILYNARTEGFFSPVNSPLPDTGVVCWELSLSSDAAEYSSMNFMLQNGAIARVADGQMTEICQKYFNYGYWPQPARGFVSSTHFLHSRERITTVVKITKSLYIVDEVGKLETHDIEGHSVQCRQVSLRSLAEYSGDYVFKNIYALMDRELAEKIESQGRLRSGFINAIVSELQYTGGRRFNILNILADYGDSYFELLQSLIGIVASKLYYRSESLSELCTIDALKEQVFNAYLDIRRHLKMPATVSDQITESFNIAIKSFFPMLVVNDEKVYYTHPLLLGFLKSWELIGGSEELQIETMIRLIRLLENAHEAKYMKVYLGDDAEYFHKRGTPKKEFIRSITRIADKIKLAKRIGKQWSE